MTVPVKPRSLKKVIILAVLQAGVVLMLIGSLGLVTSQVPKIVRALKYYQSVGSKQTDKKLDEASDSASRIEEELVQAAHKGSISAQEFQAKMDQLKMAEENRARALTNYTPAQ